jgi:signal transduction histidine kinase
MEKADSVAGWLDTVAHDLKSPLNAVRGCLDSVQGFGSLNERQQHYLDRAFAGLQRMEHLIARIHEISWVDSDLPLELSRVNPRAIVEDVLDMLREACEKRQITTEVILPDDLFIVADASRLWQVVENLVSNAIKYNRDQGKITVRIKQEDASIHVSVEDTGIGISANDLPYVFDRFFRAPDGVRRKIEGTGLGLAITRGIIERHGGRIWVESHPGKGSIFQFSLPIWQSPAVEEGDDAHDTPQRRAEGREGRKTQETSLNSEERDAVNDDLQESREITQVDSAVDEM